MAFIHGLNQTATTSPHTLLLIRTIHCFRLHRPFLIRDVLDKLTLLPDRVCWSHWPGKSRTAVRRTTGDCGYDIAPMRDQPGQFADYIGRALS
jgi:hypothetical protein